MSWYTVSDDEDIFSNLDLPDFHLICRTCREVGHQDNFELGRCEKCRESIEAAQPPRKKKVRRQIPAQLKTCPGCGGPKSPTAINCMKCHRTGRLNNPNWGSCPLCQGPMRLDKCSKYNSCYKCRDEALTQKYVYGVVKECRCGRYYSSQYDECWTCGVASNIEFGALTLNQCDFCRQFFSADGFKKKSGRRTSRCIGCSSRSAVIASLPRDNYDRHEIADRDGWVCGLCGEGIDKLITDTIDPGYLNVDHIIPVSAPNFPGDIRSNVQASHRLCNIKKGGYKFKP